MRMSNDCLAIGELCRISSQEPEQGGPSKKVLLVSYYFPPCVYGYAIRIYNFMRFLSCFGWKPYVLTIDPVYYKEKGTDSKHFGSSTAICRTGSLEPRRSLFGTIYQNKSKPNGKQISGDEQQNSSARSKYTKNHLLLPDNQILWLPYAFSEGQKLIYKEGIDLIYVTSPPFSPLLVGYLLKKATGRPFLFEYRDTWQDNLDHRQNLSRVRRILEDSLERVVVGNADRVIMVTEGMKKSIVRKFPHEPEDKFQIVPNGFDPKLCAYLNQHVPEKTEFFTVTYSGSLEYDRDPRQFLLAMKELFGQYPETARRIRIDLIGNTEAVFVDFVREQGLLANVRFLGYLPYEENVKHLASSDLLLLIANDTRPDSIPGKLYEYLLLNKPILALVGNNVSGDFLAAYPRACLIKPEDRAGMKDFVRKSFKFYAENGYRDWELDRTTLEYCRKNQARNLAQVFDRVYSKHLP